MSCVLCENASSKSTVIRAVKAASETFVTPGAISIIRNGGWEGAFRNEIMLELEKQNQQLLGFTEGADGEAVRVDLMIRCTKCQKSKECQKAKLKLGIETKINFYSQPAQEIIKQLEDGFAKASRLAGLDAALPVFLVHAVADLWCDSENDNDRAAQHNNVVTMHSYKRFRVQDPRRDRATSPNGRQKSVKRWIFDNSEWTECQRVCSHPEESTLSIPEEGQSVSVTRLRIWIAQVKKTDKQYQLEFIRANETCIETQLLSETEVNEILARNNKKNKKPIRWLPNKPKTKT